MYFWTDVVWYRDFYDVPRLFAVAVRGGYVLFESRFDDVLDDYAPTYELKLLAGERDRSPQEMIDEAAVLQPLGHADVAMIQFDASSRRRANVPRTIGSRLLRPRE